MRRPRFRRGGRSRAACGRRAPRRPRPSRRRRPRNEEATSRPETARANAATSDPAAGVEALRADLQETKDKLAELEAKQEEAEAEAAVSEEALLPEPLKIYGFADVGAQHHWIDDSSLVANVLDTRGPSFVIGNLNLYFDAQPIKDWRALVEIRFTNAPQGLVTNYGGLAGSYERVDTKQNDPHAAQLNAPMWRGSTVIERAWIEWNRLAAAQGPRRKLVHPFGIWNEDHGTPTLISLALPQFMLQSWMPVRQTGVMAYGNTFSGEWELGYAATFSNGRQELSNFNFDGKFGYGGRPYARRDTGHFNSTFGLSFFTGKTSDEAVNVTGIAPASFETEVPWEYNEYVMGADASVDIGDTRFRAEGIARRVIYTEGKRPPGDQVFGPGSYSPDKWSTAATCWSLTSCPGWGSSPTSGVKSSRLPPSSETASSSRPRGSTSTSTRRSPGRTRCSTPNSSIFCTTARTTTRSTISPRSTHDS